MRRRLVFAASVLFSIVSTAVLAASQTYTTLDPPGSSYAVVYAVSANGTIAGYCGLPGSNLRAESFVIDPTGNYTFYSIPYGYSTDVFAVNNFGSTTGTYSVNLRGRLHEYARDAKGKIEYLDPPKSTYAEGQFAGINNLDQVTGDFADNAGTHGFVAALFGPLTLFDVPGAAETFGGVINDAGVSAGIYYPPPTLHPTHSYVRDQFGNITAFDPPDSVQGTYAEGINTSGQISGIYVDANYGYHGFIRAVDGTFTIIDVPGAGTGEFQGTTSAAINDAGQVAGTYYDSNYLPHGFLRDQFGNFTTFEEPNAGTGLDQGTLVYGLSNTGVIVGYYYDSKSNLHAFKRQ